MKCLSGNNCCVARQLFGFNNQDTIYERDNATKTWGGARDAVTTVALSIGYENPRQSPEAGQILWSVAWDKPDNGQKRLRKTVMPRYNAMCTYIAKNGLGTVTRVPTVVNPNHGSFVKTAVWNIDHEGMRLWARKQGLANDDYQGFYR